MVTNTGVMANEVMTVYSIILIVDYSILIYCNYRYN